MKRQHNTGNQESRDEGYLLLGALVAIALVLIALSVAATRVAFSLRREREVESCRRADQYVRAIRKYYMTFHQYPGSIEQLEKTNNVRFLRKRYIDPLTGKSDWRIIGVGQNKTTVKGFFGQPLEGLPTGGLGAAAGMQAAGMPGSSPTAGGTSSGIGGLTAAAGGATSSGFGGSTGAGGTAASGAAGTAGTATGGTTAGGSGSSASTSGGSTDSSGTSGSSSGAGGLGAGLGSGMAVAIMGVGSNAAGNSIVAVNGQTTYQTWEFLYDPRVELLKVKQQLNSGVGSTSANALGSSGIGSSATGSGLPGSSPVTSGTPGSSPTGTPSSTQP